MPEQDRCVAHTRGATVQCDWGRPSYYEWKGDEDALRKEQKRHGYKGELHGQTNIYDAKGVPERWDQQTGNLWALLLFITVQKIWGPTKYKVHASMPSLAVCWTLMEVKGEIQ